MEALQLLSRSEMKMIKGGYMQDAWMECDNCNNSSCRGWVSSCSKAEALKMCGPGFAGSGGPRATCVEVR